MPSHRPPAPARRPRLWLALMGAACAGMVLPPIVLAAQSVAPQPVVERLSLTPERPVEPVGHGGPLSVPTVGVVAEETSGGLPPIVRTTRTIGSAEPPQRPQEASETARGSTDSHPALPGVSSATPETAMATPGEEVTDSAQDSTTPVGNVGASEAPAITASPTASPTSPATTASPTSPSETTRSDPTWTRACRCGTRTPPAPDCIGACEP
jgi:hypothetical protein